MMVVVEGQGLLLASHETRGAAKHPTTHWTAPATKNYVVQNINSAEGEKP